MVALHDFGLNGILADEMVSQTHIQMLEQSFLH